MLCLHFPEFSVVFDAMDRARVHPPLHKASAPGVDVMITILSH
jgi:hypothetical protein